MVTWARRTPLLLAAITLPIFLGCSDSSGPGTINPTGTFTGAASGISGGVPATGTLTFTLAQSGLSITGTWTNSFGASGTGTATLSGTTLTFSLTQNNPCAGTFSGSATVQNNGNRLSGSYSGSDCAGAGSGTFVVNRT